MPNGWEELAKKPSVLIAMFAFASMSVGAYMGDQVEVVVEPEVGVPEPIYLNYTVEPMEPPLLEDFPDITNDTPEVPPEVPIV